MNEQKVRGGSLYFLWHPGTKDTFSGYGLTVQSGQKDHLVGLLMVDRPRPVDPLWLAEVESKFGGYELYVMTTNRELGIACQMWVEADSQAYVRQIDMPLAVMIKQMISPLLQQPPKPRLKMRWDEALRLWTSQFQE